MNNKTLCIDYYNEQGDVISTKEFNVDGKWLMEYSNMNETKLDAWLKNDYCSDESAEIYRVALINNKIVTERDIAQNELIR